MTPKHRAQYDELYSSLGLTLHVLPPRSRPPIATWDGCGTVCFVGTTPWDDDLFSHELGHYLVASPRGRSLLDWGLGPSIQCHESKHKPDKDELGFDVDYTREAMASILGILIQKQVEGHKIASRTFDAHSWSRAHDEGAGGAKNHILELMEHGHVIWHNGRLRCRATTLGPLPSEIWRREPPISA